MQNNNINNMLNSLSDEQIKNLFKDKYSFDIDPKWIRDSAKNFNPNVMNNFNNNNFEKIENVKSKKIELTYYSDLFEIDIKKEIKKLSSEMNETIDDNNLSSNNKLILLIEIKNKLKELLIEYMNYKPLIKLIFKIIIKFKKISNNEERKTKFCEEFYEYFIKIKNIEYFEILGKLLEDNKELGKLKNIYNFVKNNLEMNSYFKNLEKDYDFINIDEKSININSKENNSSNNNNNNEIINQQNNTQMNGLFNNDQSGDLMKNMFNSDFMKNMLSGNQNNDLMKNMWNNNQNTPNMNNIDGKQVDFALDMIKNNPGMIKSLWKNFAQNNPSLNFIANMSENKISILIKTIIFFKNIISFLIRQKNTIIILIVSFWIYKLI